MNKSTLKMNGDSMIGQEVLLSADYPRLALSIMEGEGYGAPGVLRELNLPASLLDDEQVPIEWHYRIIEFGRGNIADFRTKMAERCGVVTLGPLLPAVLASRCAREALLLVATYIPMLDRSCDLQIAEGHKGLSLLVRHSMMSDANCVDFAVASFHIAACIIAAGLTTTDFDIKADYYNMGEIGTPLRWGDHMVKEDDGDRRCEIYISSELADRRWAHTTAARYYAEREKLDEIMRMINAAPTLKAKIEKGYASSDVRRGKPMQLPQQTADYFNMTIPQINDRLKKHGTTLKKIWMQYAVRHAIVLAQETDLTLEEINDLTMQHSSTSNFTRAIKKHTGYTLTELREGVGLYMGSGSRVKGQQNFDEIFKSGGFMQ